RIIDLEQDILKIYYTLVKHLEVELKEQTSINTIELYRALSVRPLIYSGGGSTFKKLRLPYGGFKEIIHVSDKQWRTEAMSESRIVQENGLCPILSTAYGLSIHMENDNIHCEPFRDIFANLRNVEDDIFESKFSYADDYSAWK
ncbi:MAG: hypothetical protein IKU18_04850, partial [Bacteroidales bacterium]|nr:hypothetical protein [Bacteroidales bacterium]